MNRYMAQFIMDRFIEFEIQQPQAKGLKIPVTAVTEKNFYMVPKSYAAQGGDSTDIGFNKEVYSADGTSVLFVPLNEDFEDDEFYYSCLLYTSKTEAAQTMRSSFPLLHTAIRKSQWQ